MAALALAEHNADPGTPGTPGTPELPRVTDWRHAHSNHCAVDFRLLGSALRHAILGLAHLLGAWRRVSA